MKKILKKGKAKVVKTASPADVGRMPEVAEQIPDNTNSGAESGNPNFADRPSEGGEQNREKTLYLKVDSSGTPLWERMTPASIDTWQGIFQHPATGSKFSAVAVPPEDSGAKAADVRELLTWLSFGQGMLFSRMTGLPKEEAVALCMFDADERESLEPRLARLMNKYGGEWVSKYGDEIFFASTLGMGIARKFAKCHEAAALAASVKEPAKPAVDAVPVAA